MRTNGLALVYGAALMLMSDGAAAQQQFNGSWSVEVIPQRGNCDRTLTFPVIVQNGQIRYGGMDGLAVSGGVTAKGSIRGSVGAGPVQVSVVGRLKGQAGSGTWASAGSLICSGQWRAAKRA